MMSTTTTRIFWTRYGFRNMARALSRLTNTHTRTSTPFPLHYPCDGRVRQRAKDHNDKKFSYDEFEGDKVCLIGSGNWGSAIATILGKNCKELPFCDDQVNMWVHEETVHDRTIGTSTKLTSVINQQHENVKYLPGIKLPNNIVANPDLREACKDATLLLFVVPHQFINDLIPDIREAVVAPNARGVSLIKGLGA